MAARTTRGLRAVWALACVMLASCGGGGSGGNPSSGSTNGPASVASPVSVGNVRFQPLDHEAFEGGDLVPPLTITADVMGDLAKLAGRTVYVGVEDPGKFYASNPQLNLTANGLGVELVLFARGPNTQTGDFRSEIRVDVCMDAECRQPFAGSPIKVPYRVKILPGLRIVQQGDINLSTKFGDPLPNWRSAVSLPAGVTKFDAAIFNRGFRVLNNSVEVKKEADALTVQARPAHATSYRLDLYVEAQAQTSSGRKVALSETRPITYTTTAPDRPTVVFTPASGRMVRTPTSLDFPGSGNDAGAVQMMSPDATPYYVAARVEYLDASNGGLDDAKNYPWLDLRSIGYANDTSSTLFPTTFRYSLYAGCSGMAGAACMPPGSYLAKVILLTADNTPAPQPFIVRLDVLP